MTLDRDDFGPRWLWTELTLDRVDFRPRWLWPSWLWTELSSEWSDSSLSWLWADFGPSCLQSEVTLVWVDFGPSCLQSEVTLVWADFGPSCLQNEVTLVWADFGPRWTWTEMTNAQFHKAVILKREKPLDKFLSKAKNWVGHQSQHVILAGNPFLLRNLSMLRKLSITGFMKLGLLQLGSYISININSNLVSSWSIYLLQNRGNNFIKANLHYI